MVLRKLGHTKQIIVYVCFETTPHYLTTSLYVFMCVCTSCDGWQVTLCDLIWHVISRSGVVISITNCYIRSTLLYFYSW